LQGSGIFHDVVIHCCVVLSQKTKRTHSFTHVCKISRWQTAPAKMNDMA